MSVVIGLAGQDLVTTVELLEQHDPGELVRERHRPERQPHVAVLEVDALGPADDEHEVEAGLAALLQKAAEALRVEGLPSAARSTVKLRSGTRLGTFSSSRTSITSTRARPAISFW